MNSLLSFLGILLTIISLLSIFYFVTISDNRKTRVPVSGLFFGLFCLYISKRFQFAAFPKEILDSRQFLFSSISISILLLYMIGSGLYIRFVEHKKMEKFLEKHKTPFSLDNMYKSDNLISDDTEITFLSYRTDEALKFNFTDIEDKALMYIIRNVLMGKAENEDKYIGSVYYKPNIFKMVKNNEFVKWMKKVGRRRFFEFYVSCNPIVVIEFQRKSIQNPIVS